MKKIATLILSIAMLFSLCTPVMAAEGGTPPDGDNNYYVPPSDPKVYISSVVNTIFKAGDIIALPMNLNVKEAIAYNVRMRMTGPEGKETNFGFYTSTGWQELGDISTETAKKPFVQVAPSTPDGTYTVKVEFTYTREATTFTATDSIIISVHGRSDSVLRLNSAKFTSAEIGTENKSKLNVAVSNPSPQTFNNVSISLNAEGSKGFSLYENFVPIALGNVEAGKAKTATFSVYVDSATVTGNYPLTFDLTYTDGSGSVITSKEVIPVQVNRSADADGKGNVPRIIVSKYSTNVEQIKAGQEFTLDFALQNTSAKTTVKNIKVVLSSSTTTSTGTEKGSGDVFFAAAGSNSFYIPSIAPGASVNNEIKLMSKQDVEPGVYAVHLKIDYEDEKGTTIPSADEQISFSVVQEQRLEVQSMNIPTDGMTGSAIPINFQYINKGKATIYNLSVTVEGDFTLEGGSQYIGNLTAGYNDYFDNVVTPTKEGESKGTIVLTFEDLNGNEKQEKTEFTCNVAPMGEMTMGDANGSINGGAMMPGMQPAEKKGGSLIWWIGIPAVVVIAGALTAVILLKKRKAKKVLVEDEED